MSNIDFDENWILLRIQIFNQKNAKITRFGNRVENRGNIQKLRVEFTTKEKRFRFSF